MLRQPHLPRELWPLWGVYSRAEAFSLRSFYGWLSVLKRHSVKRGKAQVPHKTSKQGVSMKHGSGARLSPGAKYLVTLTPPSLLTLDPVKPYVCCLRSLRLLSSTTLSTIAAPLASSAIIDNLIHCLHPPFHLCPLLSPSPTFLHNHWLLLLLVSSLQLFSTSYNYLVSYWSTL